MKTNDDKELAQAWKEIQQLRERVRALENAQAIKIQVENGKVIFEVK